MNAGMCGQRRTSFGTKPGNDVERAIGQPGLPREVRKSQCRQTGFLRRFQNAGISHCQSRPDRTTDDLHWVIPRDDVAGHTMRFTQGIDRVSIKVGDCLPHHLVGRSSIKFAISRQRHGIGAGLRQRFADIGGFDSCEILDTLEDQLAHPGENSAPFYRSHGPPSAVAGRMCRTNCGINIRGSSARDLRQFGAI